MRYALDASRFGAIGPGLVPSTLPSSAPAPGRRRRLTWSGRRILCFGATTGAGTSPEVRRSRDPAQGREAGPRSRDPAGDAEPGGREAGPRIERLGRGWWETRVGCGGRTAGGWGAETQPETPSPGDRWPGREWGVSGDPGRVAEAW